MYDPPTRAVLAAVLLLGVSVAASSVLHAYRYYRWLTYGEPMP